MARRPKLPREAISKYDPAKPKKDETMDNREKMYREMQNIAEEVLTSDSRHYFRTAFLDGPFEPRSISSTEIAYSNARSDVSSFIHKVGSEIEWSDVIGNDEAKQALLEAVEAPTVHADLYAHYGMKSPGGCLLWGPPGCGKTMFAKAAASALARLHGKETEMLLVNGAELQSPWVGKTEEKIRQFFEFARAYRAHRGHSLVIFIDEADAIFPPRDSGPWFNASNVGTLLAEMDGLKENAAYVILASNRPDQIDEALLRDGRVSHKVKIERPTYAAAQQILFNELVSIPRAEAFIDISQEISQTLDYLVHPDRRINELIASNGTEIHKVPLTLAHILSGALLVGLISRAKAHAFRRDLTNGTISGVSSADLLLAVDQLVTENKGLSHNFAAQEVLDQFTARLEADNRRMMN